MKTLLLFFMLVSSAANSMEPYPTDCDKPWLIIFLDIDGVLYREPVRHDFWEERKDKMIEIFGKLDHYWSFHYDVATAYYFDFDAVATLENFIDQTSLRYNVGIVLSSAWREGRTLEEIYQVFSPWRFSEFIIDKTVGSAYDGYTREEIQSFFYGFASRADQINHWLKHHSHINIAHFIIFDDQDRDLSKRFPNQFIQVKTRYLSLENIVKATTIINSQEYPLTQ
jgi:hypothetical protein